MGAWRQGRQHRMTKRGLSPARPASQFQTAHRCGLWRESEDGCGEPYSRLSCRRTLRCGGVSLLFGRARGRTACIQYNRAVRSYTTRHTPEAPAESLRRTRERSRLAVRRSDDAWSGAARSRGHGLAADAPLHVMVSSLTPRASRAGRSCRAAATLLHDVSGSF